MKINLAEEREGGIEVVRELWCIGGTGLSSATLSRRRQRSSGTGLPCPWPTNFPGTVSGDPNTSSAGDEPRSSFGIVRSPTMTQ